MGSIRKVIWAELGKVKDQLQDVPRLCELFEKIQQTTMLSNILNRYLKELYLLSIVVSQWLVTAIKVCLRHMCLVLLRPARPSHQSLYKCLHHQWCHRLRFQFLRINYPHDLQCLLILLRCSQKPKPHFSTVIGQIHAGAIRMNITNPEEWAAGDVAVIRNQEAKKVRDIGSLIFETPIQHDYEEGVEVRSLLSSEQLEEIDGRMAIVDTSPMSGARVVRFWVDEPSVHEDSVSGTRTPMPTEQRGINTPTRRHTEGGCSGESPDFGGGVDYHDLDSPRRERLPGSTRESPPRNRHSNTPQRIRIHEDVLYTPWNR